MFRKCAGFGIVALLVLAGAIVPAANAHETDQFTVPPGREFADLGPTLTRWAYRAVETGVDQTNNRIRDAIKAKRSEESIKKLQSPDEVAMAVNAAFPPALFSIEQWDIDVQTAKSKANFPGRVVGYKPFIGVRKYAEFSLDPFRAWNCATIKGYGVYFGTDKLGHFTDMGKHYYRKYRASLADGKDEDRAMRSAVNLGADGPLFFSETGFLGEKTAGAYSNADLVSNFMGMMFYRNLTDEVSLKGQKVPPMLVLDETGVWKITDRVRPDSDFFSLFVSDHWDEALNPSRYVERHRDKIRKAIEEHGSDTIDRYVDAHGNRRSPAYFAKRQEELSTYWGFDYGHKGDDKTLLTIANTCFPGMPKEMKPGQCDRFGMTALHLAAREGNVELARQMIEEGADVNARVRSGEKRSPEWGSTPLHYAVRDGHIDVARLLIEKGADVNAANDRGVTPLHRAIYNAEMARLLIEKGATLDAADERGQTPLHWAALDGAADATASLLAANASVAAADHQGRTPLHVAAACGNASSVKALIARRADADIGDRFGVTPLHLAARSSAEPVTAALLEAGAAPNAQDSFGVTPLHEAARHDAPAVIERLLASNADPSLADLYGATPLHVAARYADASVASLLLDAGADAMARAGRRGTPIDEARRTKNGPVLALMRDAEASAAHAASATAGQ
jgi:ankyrin repeat protein